MSSFTEPLVVEFVSPKDWRLAHPFIYHVGEYPSAQTVKVPVGFRTDGASVPRIFWNIFSPWGSYAKAAVVHDYLYATKALTLAHDDSSLSITKYDADRIFREAMRVLKVPVVTRQCLYWAVRLFGYFAWRKAR